jgi:elongation factor P
VATTADFKNGLVLVIDGQLWTITEFQHVKPGKGPAFVRTKLKNVLSGKVVDKTYNAGVKVDTATVDRRDTTYLYRDGGDFVFMDSQDYEQHPLPESLVGDDARFLLEGLPVQVAFHNGAPLYLELPVTVEIVVAHTEPGLQGDRSSAGTKPATLETGAEIQVPLFINTGDKLKVDSRDGSYLESRSSRLDPLKDVIRPANARWTCCSRLRHAGSARRKWSTCAPGWPSGMWTSRR